MNDKLTDLQARKEAAYNAGSPRSVERQHEKGKLLARERIAVLLDEGSFHELDLLARHRAHAAGLTTVLCVGETLIERQEGRTENVIATQLDALLAADDALALLENLVIAYEPVWAIGTGETATPEHAQAVHHFIRTRLAGLSPVIANATRVLYGGSVKPGNAAELFGMPDIDGGLIGGAALKAEDFIAICGAARARLASF
jgi:triosephosphate isomerase